MRKIVFQKTGMSDLTLERARSYPISEPYQLNQERYLTENGQPKVVKYGDPVRFIEVQLKGLSRDNYDGVVNGLLTWFSDPNIDWSKNSFTMIDEYGQQHTVRLWQDDFNMKQDSWDSYSIRLKLLKEG